VEWECCWDKDVISVGECPNIQEGEEDLLASKRRRILEKCSDCSVFKRDLTRFDDGSHSFSSLVELFHGEYQRQKIQIQSLASFLDNKTLQIRFLHELGFVLQSSVDLEEVLSVALTAITAGKGFGMNRAFLLLKDREAGQLKGHMAIGPRNFEEAVHSWDEIIQNDMDLKTLAQNFRQNKLSAERAKFHDILEQLTFSTANKDHVIIKALDSKRPVLIEDAFHHPDVPPEFARLLGVDTFLLMPLVSRSRRVGIIIADNCITHRHITEEDMHSLESFSFPVAFAIERASLYDKLQVELDRVTEAGKKLKEQQELIVRMEKMALVGRITSSIAHSVRNPLMIIGGFARSLLKNCNSADPQREFMESIVAETRHLESVLDEILNYADSLYPTRDFWDVGQLIDTALREASDQLTSLGYATEFSSDNDLPPVYIDFKQISYCLRTMLQSDIDGIGEDKTIVISAHRSGNSVILRVEDRSHRISQADLDRLLIPFSETRDLGAGLGLALCKAMLEKQGVPFEALADPHKGTVYTIALPNHKEVQP
jgi:signal transduction histidine kinase